MSSGKKPEGLLCIEGRNPTNLMVSLKDCFVILFLAMTRLNIVYKGNDYVTEIYISSYIINFVCS